VLDAPSSSKLSIDYLDTPENGSTRDTWPAALIAGSES
jgi:hypothetical protein